MDSKGGIWTAQEVLCADLDWLNEQALPGILDSPSLLRPLKDAFLRCYSSRGISGFPAVVSLFCDSSAVGITPRRQAGLTVSL